MLRDRNIAFFIDIDGLRLKTENYDAAIEQLESMGTILFGKLYGCGERKHKAICKEADLKGYRLERVKRVKRRGRREFDNRIFVDVVDTVCNTPAVDAVAIASPSCDMVYLYSYLRGRGIKIIALDNVDEASKAFIDEFLDLGIELEVKLPYERKERAAKPSEPKASTNDLLREIESLKSMVAEQGSRPVTVVQTYEPETATETEEDYVAEEPIEESAEEPAAEHTEESVYETADETAEEPADELLEETPQEEQDEVSAEPIDEAKELLEKYYAVASGEETAVPEEEAADAEVSAEEPARKGPRASYVPQSDSDLIRQIEAIRNGGDSGVPDDLAEQIRKLLEGIE